MSCLKVPESQEHCLHERAFVAIGGNVPNYIRLCCQCGWQPVEQHGPWVTGYNPPK